MKIRFLILVGLCGAIACGCGQQSTLNPPVGENSASTPANPSQRAEGKGNIGVFRKVDHRTDGRVRIASENGQRYLEFDQDFRTDSGPDLFVILHRNATVGKGVKERDYVNIARLQRNQGSQRYQIPSNVNLSDYKSVAIWCRQFNVTFGYAPI